MLSVWQENMGLLVLSLFLHLSLHLQGGLAMFRSFLRSEFSEENIEFWVACEDFKKTKSPMKMAVKARKIYEDFIQTEGPREVTENVAIKSVIVFVVEAQTYLCLPFYVSFSLSLPPSR